VGLYYTLSLSDTLTSQKHLAAKNALAYSAGAWATVRKRFVTYGRRLVFHLEQLLKMMKLKEWGKIGATTFRQLDISSNAIFPT